MNMFDIDSRRNNTNRLTSFVEKVMVRINQGDRALAGWNVFIIHTILVVIVYYLLLWGNSRIGFLVGLVLWLSFVIQHLYFDGCWAVKSERRIWRVKDWYGPWTVLFNAFHKFGMPATKPYHNVFFILFTLILGILALERYINFNRMA